MLRPQRPEGIATDTMLILRDEQMAVFDTYMLKQFENMMVGHLNQYFPESCRDMGDKKVREMIQYGVERARLYGIHIENDVSRYINLMFSFGREFDTDPNCAWAQNILDDDDLVSTSKMDALYTESGRQIPKEAQ